MAELNFLKTLDKDQLEYARQVAIKAKELGVPPALAISIAFKESSLRPDAPDSEDGAVGLMQILPKTAKTYGYSEKDLRDTAKNIEAGIKNIKEALEYTGNDPKLTAVYYHSGPDAIADLASGKPMGPRAKEYVKKLNEFGTFGFSSTVSGEAAPAEQTEQAEQKGQADEGKLDTTGVKMVTPEQDFIRENSEADLRRQEYGLAGGVTGAAIAGAPVASKVATGAMGRVARAIAPQPTGSSTSSLLTAGAPTPLQAPQNAPMGGLPQGQPQSIMRQGAPATGYGTYNYGLSQGLTDIESGLAKDMTKESGGVHDLLTQRREALNRLQGMGVNNFVENPRFGGIMTAAPSVGGGPRESFALRSPDTGQVGQPAELQVIPKAAPIPTTPPPPSGLDQVKNMFTNMMRHGSRIMPFVGPPLAGLSIGRDLADIQTQYERAPVERDYTDMGLSAAGALATGATLTPAWPAALPLSIGLPTVRNIRRNVIAQESEPDYQHYLKSEPTAQELETASRPAFRYARP